MSDWTLTGGAGFIGQHLAWSILRSSPSDKVLILDIQKSADIRWKMPLEQYLAEGRLRLLNVDVRDMNQMLAVSDDGSHDVIVNLAAVHREPGHEPREYVDTNVHGAEHTCAFAHHVGCEEIIFTSSISVYGEHEKAVDEKTPAAPKTPYGRSKFKAEQVHRRWARHHGGRLLIVRPGVVFGPGEEGNVTRLVELSLKLGRAVQVSPDVPKAAVYIDELLSMFDFCRPAIGKGDTLLVNGVSDEQLNFNSFGRMLAQLQGFDKKALKIPGSLVRLGSLMLRPAQGMISPASSIHPERIAKLRKANDVRPGTLTEMNYPYRYPLDRAMTEWLDKGIHVVRPEEAG